MKKVQFRMPSNNRSPLPIILAALTLGLTVGVMGTTILKRSLMAEPTEKILTKADVLMWLLLLAIILLLGLGVILVGA